MTMAVRIVFGALVSALFCFQSVRAELGIRGMASLNQTLYSNHRDLGVTYCPGDFSDRKKSTDNMIHISNGLTCKRIATSGERVKLKNGKYSSEKFHAKPDGAATYMKKDGGWYYISNAEVDKAGTTWNHGGVGRIEFDKNGKVVDYKKIANKMRKNCGGGKTPWNTWVTCEESKNGKVWQVDPSDQRSPRLTDLGMLGKYESFAYDLSMQTPTFYVTRDASDGVCTRFTPNAKGMECFKRSRNYDRWCTLDHGTKDYLYISGGSSGTFTWIKDKDKAAENARKYYPSSEGIDSHKGKVYFVSKDKKRLIILNLKKKTYTYSSTKSGAFNTEPDQVQRLVSGSDSILYFCEDGGATSGVFGRSVGGKYFTVMIGRTDLAEDETTGLAFGRDAKHMYVSYQEGGWIYDCTRDDGRPFDGNTLDIKYHAS